MSETNSVNPLQQTSDETRSADAPTPSVPDAADPRLFERLGVGGMGEVYRCGDDVFGRDLALKVLRAELHGDASAEERFLREARLTGSLQHPGIVPIYNLSRLVDGRPCYTMKLVRGRTFADLLRDEPDGPERLPRLLAVIEKVCQAVAYAHSKGVIHRDLKPSNVMVGEFGEVQVMDWGLAKELFRDEVPQPNEVTEDLETVARTEEAEGLSRAGLALGTPSYMPPEQAAGDWPIVDERADVFALGAMLCGILTGQPPYHGTNRDDLLRRARRGDLSEAWTRLEKCGADTALIQLVRACLSAEREGRPRHAGVVAERVAAYQAEVQERLRQAELERVAAEARAAAETERAGEARARVKAERRAKRRTLALAAALMVLLAVGGCGLWWRQLQRDRADRAALSALERGRQRLHEGWRLHDLAMLREAKAEAERAADFASGGVTDAVEQQVADFQKSATERLARAEKNRELLNALLDIVTPHEIKTSHSVGSGQMMTLAAPSVEEQFADAFRRRWPDVDIDKQAESEVAARLQEEPEVVLQGVIAGLDGWMLHRQRLKRPQAEWRRLLGLVERLDHSEPRQQLRALLIGALPPRAREVAGLLAGWPPWIALWELGRGSDWGRLRQLRGQMDVSAEPVLTVLLLAHASREVGDMAGAEAVLRQALARRPNEVALLDALGKFLNRRGRSRLVEAIGCYRAARASRPGLGIVLGQALTEAGQAVEAEAVLRDLLRQQPNNPEMFLVLGNALGGQGKPAQMEAAYRQAIVLKPNYAEAYNNLGMALNDQGKPVEAEAVCRRALALKPNLAEAYTNLGSALNDQRKHAEAEVAHRQAIALKPDSVEAYTNLGNALDRQGKHKDAEAAHHQAIVLKPDFALAHNNLGLSLNGQRKYAQAEAAYRKAIALKPDYFEAYTSLGQALERQGKHEEAEAACRKAIELKPDDAKAYNNLGIALRSRGKPAEAEAAHRQAIALQPDNTEAYSNLGIILFGQGKHEEAEEAWRKAMAHSAEACFNLGLSLNSRGKPAEAAEAWRQAIALKPDLAEAHCNLGGVLRRQGRLSESLAAYRRGHELGSKQPGWRYPSLQWVRRSERLVELEKKIPAILQGTASPANPGEAIALASMCQQPYQKCYAASARLYADAFAAEPKFAADLNQQHRYSAACSAALAAAGKGEDARRLPDKVAAMFRCWALSWLREDLKAYGRLVGQNNPATNKAIQQRMAQWRRNADLASVRDQPGLDRLAENERAAWQALWRDVDKLAERTAKKIP